MSGEEKKYGNGGCVCMGTKKYYQQSNHWLETTHRTLQNPETTLA